MQTALLLDLIYPRTCGGCGGRVGGEGRYLCWDCRSELILVRPPYCRRCGDPIEGRVDHEFVCYTCSAGPIHFDRARSAARYDGVLGRVLRDFKYNQAIWLGPDLVELLWACYRTHYETTAIDAVCYVPLFHAKRRHRGYNQAERLAAPLARCIGKPLLRRCLVRVRPAPSQTNLTARNRATNVTGAFQHRRADDLKGRRLLLVDDVMTTGATVNACARVLKEGGAAEVTVLTLARG